MSFAKAHRIFVLLFLLAAALSIDAAVWHVAPYGSGNGGSWQDALSSLEAALSHAEAGDEIWLAAGEYTPAVNYSEVFPNGSFKLKDGVNIYGGFSGSESSATERERADQDGNGLVELWEFAHPSVITHQPGVIGALLDSGEAAFTEGCVIDGLIVTGGISDGRQDGSSHPGLGGGAFLNGAITLRQCTFADNRAVQGGGVYALGEAAIDTCCIRGNHAELSGAGVSLIGEGGSAVNSLWLDNGSENECSLGGGALAIEGDANISFCTFVGNAAAGKANSVITEGNACLRNSVIWGGSGHLQSVLLRGESYAVNCAITAGGATSPAGSGCLNVLPENCTGNGAGACINFSAPEQDCFALAAGSCAINRGITYHDMPEFDAAGEPREQCGAPDIGAFESSAKGAITVSAHPNGTLVYGLSQNLTLDASEPVNWSLCSSAPEIVDIDGDELIGVNAGTAVITIVYTPVNEALWASGSFTIPVTVLPRPITITAHEKTWHSGDQRPALTWSFSAGKLHSGDSIAGELSTSSENFPSELPAALIIERGSIGISPASHQSNYDLTFIPGYLECLPNPEVISIEDQRVTYNGEAVTPRFTTNPAGLPVTLDFFAAKGKSSAAALPSAPVLPGEYIVTATVNDGTYHDSASARLTIDKATLVCTADNLNRMINQATPELTCQYSGLVGSDTPASLESQPVLSTSAAPDSPAGIYPITVSGGADSRYTIVCKPGTLTISQKMPVINEPEATVMTYGAPLSRVWLMAYTTDPENGEYVAGEFIWSQPDLRLDAGCWVCDWSFVPEDSLTYGQVNGSSAVSIFTRPITVQATPAVKEYGEADPQWQYVISRGTLASSDTLAVDFSRSTGELPGKYTITPEEVTVSSGGRDITFNYSLTIKSAELTITKRAVEITADNQEKHGGKADPELTWRLTSGSILPGDSVTGALARDEGELPGTYAIRLGTLELPETYDLTFIGAALTILTYDIVIDSDDEGVLDFQCRELTYGELLDGQTQLTGTVLIAISGEELPGHFVWSRDGDALDAGTYDLEWHFVPDTQPELYAELTGTIEVTIKPAVLTAAADNCTLTYGGALPALTVSFAGFQYDDTPADLAEVPQAACDATPLSPAGIYVITVSGGAATNYVFDYLDGILTISPGVPELTTELTTGTITYGQRLGEAELTGSFNTEGELAWEDPDYLPQVGDTTAVWVFTPSDGNYLPISGEIAITVNPAVLTVTPDDVSGEYLNHNFSSAGTLFTGTISGFVLGETAEVLTALPTYSCSVEADSHVGVYDITASGGSAQNYVFRYLTGKCTITAHAIMVKVLGTPTKNYLLFEPVYTFSFTNLDGTTEIPAPPLTGELSREPGELPGQYQLNLGTLASLDPDYTLVLDPECPPLTITEPELTICGNSSERYAYPTSYQQIFTSAECVYSPLGKVILGAYDLDPEVNENCEDPNFVLDAGEYNIGWIFTPFDPAFKPVKFQTRTSISKRKIYVDFKPFDNVKYYGEEIVLPEVIFDENQLAPNDSIDYSVVTEATSNGPAGSYPCKLDYVIRDQNGRVRNSSYDLSYQSVPNVSLAYRNLRIRIEGRNYTYGETFPAWDNIQYTCTDSTDGRVYINSVPYNCCDPRYLFNIPEITAPGAYHITGGDFETHGLSQSFHLSVSASRFEVYPKTLDPVFPVYYMDRVGTPVDFSYTYDPADLVNPDDVISVFPELRFNSPSTGKNTARLQSAETGNVFYQWNRNIKATLHVGNPVSLVSKELFNAAGTGNEIVVTRISEEGTEVQETYIANVNLYSELSQALVYTQYGGTILLDAGSYSGSFLISGVNRNCSIKPARINGNYDEVIITSPLILDEEVTEFSAEGLTLTGTAKGAAIDARKANAVINCENCIITGEIGINANNSVGLLLDNCVLECSQNGIVLTEDENAGDISPQIALLDVEINPLSAEDELHFISCSDSRCEILLDHCSFDGVPASQQQDRCSFVNEPVFIED